MHKCSVTLRVLKGYGIYIWKITFHVPLFLQKVVETMFNEWVTSA